MKMWIVRIDYRYQDCSESNDYVYPDKESARKFIQETANRINGECHSYTLYECTHIVEYRIKFEKRSVKPPPLPPVVTLIPSIEQI